MKLFRRFLPLLVLLLIIASCKTKSSAISNSAEIKSLSARKVSNRHIAKSFQKETIDARLKVVYKDKKTNQTLHVKLRIQKDKVIWLNVTYKGIILVARAKITPQSVSYYEKINKTYFVGDFNVLRNFLGAEVNFTQLQNLLLGQAIFDLKAQKYTAEINDNAHLLTPKQQQTLFDILFWINPAHYKLDKQELKSLEKNQVLQIGYQNYALIEGETFPKHIEIKAMENDEVTSININYTSVLFNKNIRTPFRIPNGYKQVVF
ncbi:MAG: DUF4292 domain-containing protein [Flavobacteriaceae bacterium]|nr:DUF4292 domain-containing protein [Flavobacteriaceae bacterium]